MNRQLIAKIAALALCAMVAACTKTGGGGGTGGRLNSWTVPHVLRFEDAGDLSSLNPHLAQFADVGYLSSLTMAWLVKWDVNNRPYPELATRIPTKANGGVSRDGLTITYHIRRGVKWSDGVPFNADDVVFSTHVVLNPANNEVGRLGWDRIVKIDEPDKYTVVYHLKKPYSPFVETFFSSAGANPCILPKHLLAQYPNINHVAYNSLPVGIGPFKYKQWQRATRVVLVANSLYWRGLPKLHEIEYLIVPDRNTVLTQLQAHQFDMYPLVPGNYLSRVQAVSGYGIDRIVAYWYNHVDFNLSSVRLQDVAVREALRLAIDRATLREKVGHNLGFLQEQAAARTSPYWNPAIKIVRFDVAQANALLDRAGWKLGADGVRAKNGVKLHLTVAAISGLPDVDTGNELMRAWWKQIGVTIEIKHYPTALFFAPMQQGGILYGGKWDVTEFAWLNDPLGDYSPIYACGSVPPNGQNVLHWCDPKANAAMQALFTHYDQNQRNSDARTVNEQLVKDVPTIVTLGREDVYAMNSDLHGFVPNAITPFDNFMNVDI